MPPLRKPTRTYAIGVKIAGGLEVVNSSTKMQFQVNRSIFVEDMNFKFLIEMPRCQEPKISVYA